MPCLGGFSCVQAWVGISPCCTPWFCTNLSWGARTSCQAPTLPMELGRREMHLNTLCARSSCGVPCPVLRAHQALVSSLERTLPGTTAFRHVRTFAGDECRMFLA